jgi:hypothetical protein
MITTDELVDLVELAELLGARIRIEWKRSPGGAMVPDRITVRHLPGIGPFPMPPIAAAEAIRAAIAL